MIRTNVNRLGAASYIAAPDELDGPYRDWYAAYRQDVNRRFSSSSHGGFDGASTIGGLDSSLFYPGR